MPRRACLLALALVLCLPAPGRAMDAQKVFAKASGSVVEVFNLDGFKKFSKLGSGFVVGDGTQVITNQHVGEGANTVVVRTPDDKVIKVKVEDTDRVQDLALLRLEGKGPPLELAEELPQVGQEVATIGSPKGLERTLSTGIVSALRKLKGREMVQITAPVSDGSSGGPVLDESGRVVGVATSIAKEGQTLNFAVPSTAVLRFMGKPVIQRKAFQPAPEQHLEVDKAPDGSITIIQKRKLQE